jgi:hypothetical protein
MIRPDGGRPAEGVRPVPPDPLGPPAIAPLRSVRSGPCGYTGAIGVRSIRKLAEYQTAAPDAIT